MRWPRCYDCETHYSGTCQVHPMGYNGSMSDYPPPVVPWRDPRTGLTRSELQDLDRRNAEASRAKEDCFARLRQSTRCYDCPVSSERCFGCPSREVTSPFLKREDWYAP